MSKFISVAALVVVGFTFAARTSSADEPVTLQIIASSPYQTEVVEIQQTGDEITWTLILPPALQPKRQGFSQDESRGKFTARGLSVEQLFSPVAEQQQAEGFRVAPPGEHQPRYVLELSSETSQQITLPLSGEQHLAIAESELIKLVLQDINKHKLLVKPHLMLGFFYPHGAENGDVYLMPKPAQSGLKGTKSE